MTAAIRRSKTGASHSGDERNQLIVTERVRSGVRLHDGPRRPQRGSQEGEVALQVALLRLGTLRRSSFPIAASSSSAAARVDGHHPSLVAPFARL